MASGRPDWYGSMTMHGRYTIAGVDSYKSIAVDEEGNLIALMTGLLEGVYTPIAVDDEGIMRANLVLQELPFMTVRPAYGGMVDASDEDTIGSAHETSIFDIDGQGIITTILLLTDANNDPAKVYIRLKVDGVSAFYERLDLLHEYRLYGSLPYTMVLSKYDTVNNKYALLLGLPITFETLFEVFCYQTTGAPMDIVSEVCYALTPERE